MHSIPRNEKQQRSDVRLSEKVKRLVRGISPNGLAQYYRIEGLKGDL